MLQQPRVGPDECQSRDGCRGSECGGVQEHDTSQASWNDIQLPELQHGWFSSSHQFLTFWLRSALADSEASPDVHKRCFCIKFHLLPLLIYSFKIKLKRLSAVVIKRKGDAGNGLLSNRSSIHEGTLLHFPRTSLNLQKESCGASLRVGGQCMHVWELPDSPLEIAVYAVWTLLFSALLRYLWMAALHSIKNIPDYLTFLFCCCCSYTTKLNLQLLCFQLLRIFYLNGRVDSHLLLDCAFSSLLSFSINMRFNQLWLIWRCRIWKTKQ